MSTFTGPRWAILYFIWFWGLAPVYDFTTYWQRNATSVRHTYLCTCTWGTKISFHFWINKFYYHLTGGERGIIKMILSFVLFFYVGFVYYKTFWSSISLYIRYCLKEMDISFLCCNNGISWKLEANVFISTKNSRLLKQWMYIICKQEFISINIPRMLIKGFMVPLKQIHGFYWNKHPQTLFAAFALFYYINSQQKQSRRSQWCRLYDTSGCYWQQQTVMWYFYFRSFSQAENDVTNEGF